MMSSWGRGGPYAPQWQPIGDTADDLRRRGGKVIARIERRGTQWCVAVPPSSDLFADRFTARRVAQDLVHRRPR
jgi:hypothetical protein